VAEAVRSGSPLLVVEGVHKAFDGLPAVAGASFQVAPASITALIGPNGAGKTTLFNVVTGFYRADAGEVRFAGRSIAARPAHAVARLGLVRTFQITRVWAAMSVLENVMLAAPDQPGERLTGLLFRRRAAARREGLIRARALALLELFDLRAKAADYAGTLSGGQRKLLELARALMLEPRLVLLDEPMAGVNATLQQRLLAYIAELRRSRGLTFLVIEHNMEVVMNHCDHVVVMAQGRVLTDGPPAVIRRDPRVLDAYLGSAGREPS
jgi:ABC-type branched-subunit amino acid transport system ATPase component